jgi:hypothetical protein
MTSPFYYIYKAKYADTNVFVVHNFKTKYDVYLYIYGFQGYFEDNYNFSKGWKLFTLWFRVG